MVLTLGSGAHALVWAADSCWLGPPALRHLPLISRPAHLLPSEARGGVMAAVCASPFQPPGFVPPTLRSRHVCER